MTKTKNRSWVVKTPAQLERFLKFAQKVTIPKTGVEFRWGPPRRTNRQNAYLWGVVYRTLSEGLTEEYGKAVSADYTHRLCKKFFMPHVDSGVTDKSGAKIMVEMSTTELCRSGSEAESSFTEYFMDYVERIQEFAAHKGIYIPDPNEDKF